MSSLPFPLPIASAAAVFCGQRGDVTRLAQSRGVFRQTLYREAHAVLQALTPSTPTLVAQLRQRSSKLQTEVAHLRQQLQQAVVVDADRQAEFASTAQALGVSLCSTRTLLKVLLGDAAPSVSTLGRLTQQAARQATSVLALLDDQARQQARQVAADEIFVGRRPVLMTIEQDSLCWLAGRLADCRDGRQWVKEFEKLPAVEQVTRDGGQGMEKGLQLVNAQRRQAGQPAIDDQEDHFHILHRARRALREVQGKAVRAFRKAEKAQAACRRDRRKRILGGGRTAAVNRYWRQAEQAMDRWSAQEKALERLRQGLRLWTPEGRLNTPERAQQEVQAALSGLTGPEWSRVRKKLVGPKAFTFLVRLHQQLQALPVAAEVRQAALRLEELRRQPERLRGAEPSAGALRGVVLACGVVLSLSGSAALGVLARVRTLLDGVWRSSSLVEGVNSVLRMQQSRQKRMTQGLLDLKRLYWNVHEFVAGRRKGTSPYGRLGVRLPEGGWWRLLKKPVEQLRQELSTLQTAA